MKPDLSSMKIDPITINDLISALSKISNVMFLAKSSELQDISFSDVSIDSRHISKGSLFFALQGERFDGHDFINDAFKNGALLAVAQKKGFYNGPYVLVPDTVEALQELASYHRNLNQSTRIVAITGSVGKTTTKSLANHVLSHFGPTISSPKSFNNHLGVPLSILKIENTTQYALLEIGMNHVGEIDLLSQLARPHIALITAIAEAHIEHLETVENICDEKASVASGIQGKGIAIIPADTPFMLRLWDNIKNRGIEDIRTFGSSKRASTRLISKREDFQKGCSWIKVDIEGVLCEMEIPFVGHYIQGVLSVLCLASVLELDLKKVISCLKTAQLLPGRGQKQNLSIQSVGPIILIDDAYNANPTSMKASLDLFSQTPHENGRKIIVLGDMLELGEKSDAYHQELVPFISKAKPDLLLTIGKSILSLYEAIEKLQETECLHFDTVEDVMPLFKSMLKKGDMILVKGSNGSHVYKLCDILIRDSMKKKKHR